MHRTEQITLMAQVRTLSIENEIKIFFLLFLCVFFYLLLWFSFSLLVHVCFRSLSTFFQSCNLGQLSYNSVLDRLL